MKNLPLGIQTFSEMMEGDYVYADKTEYIYNLVRGGKCYFLSRPRRFGKSLLMDTMRELFLGHRELFKGLWIDSSDYDFHPYPVIRLDMSGMDSDTTKVLKDSLLENLEDIAHSYDITVEAKSPSGFFRRLIATMCQKFNEKVVILIDEYDYPITDHLTNIPQAEANREVLRSFYGILKSMDAQIRFIFLTGVTKFTRTSIFSSLNNLTDITLQTEYTNICGFTVSDFDNLFTEHLTSLENDAGVQKMMAEGQLDDLREAVFRWYDGYSWNGTDKVFNPFSLLSFFQQRILKAYWYISGTPKFLVDLLKEKPQMYITMQNSVIDEESMDSADITELPLLYLLFQAGYLTVEDVYFKGTMRYRLGVPNEEVQQAFSRQVFIGLTEGDAATVTSAFDKMTDFLRAGEPEKLAEILQGLFASIPYYLHINAEAYYHSIFYSVMKFLGFAMDAETATSEGRIDGVIKIAGKVYIMEMKYDNGEKSKDDETKRKALQDRMLKKALAQIEARGYADKYSGTDLQVYKVAIAVVGRSDVACRVVR
jgi:hypothetical protein